MKGIVSRLWTYQAERFPLLRTSLLVAAFSAASVSASAHLSARDAPHAGVYAAAFVVTLCFFFQLRVLDEIKDAEADALYRPERPIPRGLVSLRTVVALGVATVPLQAAACALVDVRLLGLLVLAWLWMGLMTAEFFAPQWLRARPFAYGASHMIVMPLIDLVLTGFEWLPGGGASRALLLFLAMSFVNGCVLEIGRKLWSPVNEREGVETYSGLMGPKRAAALWMAVVCLSALLLSLVGFATGAPVTTCAIALVAALHALRTAARYRSDPTPAMQDRMDGTAGIWVLACYVAAGFAPLMGV
jgi:4-hydroxybenzoate polyprenyltransferase